MRLQVCFLGGVGVERLLALGGKVLVVSCPGRLAGEYLRFGGLEVQSYLTFGQWDFQGPTIVGPPYGELPIKIWVKFYPLNR